MRRDAVPRVIGTLIATIATFERFRMQRATVRRRPAGSFATRPRPHGGRTPPDLRRALPVRIDVQLDADEGSFTMLNETTIDLTETP